MARRGVGNDWPRAPKSEKAFDEMDAAVLKAVSLRFPDEDKGFVLRTNASDYAVGAVQEHVQEDGSHVPAAFCSRVLWSKNAAPISSHGISAAE